MNLQKWILTRLLMRPEHVVVYKLFQFLSILSEGALEDDIARIILSRIHTIMDEYLRISSLSFSEHQIVNRCVTVCRNQNYSDFDHCARLTKEIFDNVLLSQV